MKKISPLHTWLQDIIPQHLLPTLRTERINKAYGELLSGYSHDASTILNTVEEIQQLQGLVCEKGIQFQSMCKHHFLPFVGTVDIVYEPGEFLIGLGKISRLVHVFAKRLQVQEKLTQQIVQEFMASGGVKGVYVRSSARHLCMGFRGPCDANARATCFVALGSLQDPSRLQEIQQLVK